jgi:hypothetical protein
MPRLLFLFGLLMYAMRVSGAEPELGAPDFTPTAEHPVGQRGDMARSGRYRGATAVRTWDIEKKQNLVWAAKLPSWGFGSPIAVRDRIFLQAEPNLLLCLDAHDGRLL